MLFSNFWEGFIVFIFGGYPFLGFTQENRIEDDVDSWENSVQQNVKFLVLIVIFCSFALDSIVGWFVVIQNSDVGANPDHNKDIDNQSNDDSDWNECPGIFGFLFLKLVNEEKQHRNSEDGIKNDIHYWVLGVSQSICLLDSNDVHDFDGEVQGNKHADEGHADATAAAPHTLFFSLG